MPTVSMPSPVNPTNGNIIFDPIEGVDIAVTEFQDDGVTPVDTTTAQRFISIRNVLTKEATNHPTVPFAKRILLTTAELRQIPGGGARFSYYDNGNPSVPVTLWAARIHERNLP